MSDFWPNTDKKFTLMKRNKKIVVTIQVTLNYPSTKKSEMNILRGKFHMFYSS